MNADFPAWVYYLIVFVGAFLIDVSAIFVLIYLCTVKQSLESIDDIIRRAND